MADQHRADVMGCAGDPGVQTPHLDRLAPKVCGSPHRVPGPAVHAGAGVVPHRALRARPRRLHELGRGRALTHRPTCTRCAPRATTRSRSARHHLYPRRRRRRAHVDELAGRLHERGFAEVHETGDKFSVGTPNRYTDFLAEQGLLEVYAEHIARPQLPRRVRERARRDEARADVGRDAAADPARRVHRHVARRVRGPLDRRLRTRRAVLLLRRLPRSARSVGCAARPRPRASISTRCHCPDRRGAPTRRRHGHVRATAPRVPANSPTPRR